MDYREILDAFSEAPSLTAWEMIRTRKKEHQLFLVLDGVESKRVVETETVDIHIYIDRTDQGKTVMGESQFTLNPGDDVRERLKTAIEMAGLISNEPFPLPGPGGSYHKPDIYDQEVAANPEAALSAIRNEIAGSIEDGLTLSGAEITAGETSAHFLNSRGLELNEKKTALFADFVLLTGDSPEREVEIHGFKKARLLSQLDIGGMAREYGRFAKETLSAQEPPSGTYDVVLSHEALDTFFSYYVAQAGGPAKHQGWSKLAEGKPVVESPKGDLLSLVSDPTLPGCAESASFDRNGCPLQKVTVIEEGIFKQRPVDSRYAAYLGLEPTGDFANIVVRPGAKSFDELLTEKNPTLHVLKFSTFDPRPVTGSFSGEIRFGYWLQDGKKSPVKGGSVGGIMDEAFREIYFSRETEKRGAYMGPRAVKIRGLKIAGS